MVELYKDGDTMGIATNCNTEEDFLNEMAEIIGSMIEEQKFAGDWDFQFGYWLPQIVDMCCKYRGFDSKAKESKRLIAGYTRYNIQDTDIKFLVHMVATNRNNNGDMSLEMQG